MNAQMWRHYALAHIDSAKDAIFECVTSGDADTIADLIESLGRARDALVRADALAAAGDVS